VRYKSLFPALMLSLSLTTIAAAQEAASVGVDAVIREPLIQTVPVIGRLVAAQTGVVAARISGPIAEMRVRVGDRIKKDAVISVLVKDTLHWQHQLNLARVSEAKAALATARSVVDLRVQEMTRLSQLKKSAAFSQARLEDKKLEVVSARSATAQSQAALLSAEANLRLSKINLDNAEIKAPFGGVVSERHINVGAYVNVGSPVISLIDDQHLEIEAHVPASNIDGLTKGKKVNFRLERYDSGQAIDHSATVRAIIPSEDPLTRTRTVRFTPNFGINMQGLASNQSVVLALPAGKAGTVTTVHKDAVLNKKGKDIVFIVEDGKANVRPVRLGQALGQRFVVLSGLKSGDLVVIRGNERLRPGQKVQP